MRGEGEQGVDSGGGGRGGGCCSASAGRRLRLSRAGAGRVALLPLNSDFRHGAEQL